jgi:hypothetical protein
MDACDIYLWTNKSNLPYFLTSDLTMKTVTVGNPLKSGIATQRSYARRCVRMNSWSTFLTSTFPVIDTTDLWGYGRLVNIPDVFVIDDESTNNQAIAQDGLRGYRQNIRFQRCAAPTNTPIIMW